MTNGHYYIKRGKDARKLILDYLYYCDINYLYVENPDNFMKFIKEENIPRGDEWYETYMR